MSASIVRLSALDHNKLTGMHPVRSVIRERSSQPVGAAPGRDLLEARALVVAGMACSYTDARTDWVEKRNPIGGALRGHGPDKRVSCSQPILRSRRISALDFVVDFIV